MKRLSTIKRPNKRSIKKAQVYTNSINTAVLTINDIINSGGECPADIKTIQEEVTKQVRNVINGETISIETMLAAQSMTMNLMFNRLVSLAMQGKSMEHTRMYLDMALRAQNQCRKTVIAINTIKHPQPSTVLTQQSVAINQQVNNSFCQSNKNPELNLKNELIKEIDHETLDIHRTLEAIEINSKPKALAMVDRCQNGEGQGNQQNERS